MSNHDSNSTYIDPNASPDKIEQQIDQKRNSINRTISELEDKFSPQQFMDQGTTMLREHGGDIAQSLGRSFRNNPAPFLVAGAGLAWLIASTSSTSSRGYYARGGQLDYHPRYDDDGVWSSADRDRAEFGGGSTERYYDDEDSSSSGLDLGNRVKDVASELTDTLSDTRDELGDRVSDMAEGFSDKASDLQSQATQRANQLRRRTAQEFDALQHRSQRMQRQASQFTSSSVEDASDFLRSQPMVTGAIGIAIGALLGSLLPETRLEKEYMGSAAEDVRNKAASLAEEGITHAREKVESVAEKAGEVAKEKIEEADQHASSSQTEMTPA